MGEHENREMNTRPEWDDNKCWFCKKRDAVESEKYEADLHFLSQKEKSGTGADEVYKREYMRTSIPVPRCRRCNRKHKINAVVFFIILVTLLLCGTCIHVNLITGERDASINSIISVVATIALIIAAVNFIISRVWISERKAKKYPRVKKLLDEGWKSGEIRPDD